MKKTTKEQAAVRKKNGAAGVKKPIERSLIITVVALFLVLSALIFVLAYWYFSRTLYKRTNEILDNVITHVENNANADDLAECFKTGVHSAKYDLFQSQLNRIVDDFELDYLYIVVPGIDSSSEYAAYYPGCENFMVNVISATSEAERAAGETDMYIGETTEAYSDEELARFRAFWDAEDIGFFEESSDYGAFYTACKPLRDSSGKTVALMCADLSIGSMHRTIRYATVTSILTVGGVLLLFGAVILVWMRKKVTGPLRALEKSTRTFAARREDSSKGDELEYDAPEVDNKNEVGALAASIEQMTSDIVVYINDRLAAEQRAHEAEEQNLRLCEEAAAAKKIAEISRSFTTLLDNMPALCFYKDKENGKYIACNQAFADYAGKSRPQEVIGLTDFDIFDAATAEHFTSDDRKALSMDRPYVFYEDVPDAAGNQKQFQTTKLKFADITGETRLLGMCVDVTEMMSIKRETEKAKEAYEIARSASLTYSRIARALSRDYAFLYYVNIETDEFIEYVSTASGEALTEERRGKDFFAISRRDAMTRLHENDRKLFISLFTKENVLEKIDSTGAFTLTYRLLTDDTPTYVSMKASRLKDDDAHIIIGVNNVDAQMRYQEAIERMQEERITYARITALSGDFLCIYTVDPDSCHYHEYSATDKYEGLGLAKEGDHFFEKSRAEAARILFPEDLDLFLSTMTKENILNEIGQAGIFTLEYRIMLDGAPVYVALKAAMVEEKDGPQLLIGVVNIDAAKKREQEYATNLSAARKKADVDALTGVKSKHAYNGAEAHLDLLIREAEDKGRKEDLHFAIAVFDVNDLKLTNDTRGHQAGDDLLCSAARIICGIFKHSPVFRIGGDEFAAILQGVDYENADMLFAEFIRIILENRDQGGTVVAGGMAKYHGEKNASAVFVRADAEMYSNKRDLKSGRRD